MQDNRKERREFTEASHARTGKQESRRIARRKKAERSKNSAKDSNSLDGWTADFDGSLYFTV